MKRNVVLIAIIACLCIFTFGLAACSNGKSAYEVYLEAYVEANGSADGALSEEEWLSSLKGEKGDSGKSAYEVYLDAYVEANGSADGALSEEEWLSSLTGEKGDSGKSAYEMYVEAYVEANGSSDGVLSEEEWLTSLKGDKGDKGIGIKEVKIVCGDVIITFDDDTVETLEGAYPEAGHKWDDGEITTAATCISPGIVTFVCTECKATKREMQDSTGEHRWGEYQHDEDIHWCACKICGEIEVSKHNFGDDIGKNDSEAILECVCDISQTVGEFFAYKVVFECSDGVSILVYNTQDYTVAGVASNVAYSRDADNGELLNDGEGQVNFEIVLDLGYRLKKITILQSNYKNLKDASETDRENTYRITKITGELTVLVEAEPDALSLPVIVINTKNSTPIVDKVNYIKCTVSVSNAEKEYCFTDVSAGIRGRGNSTWGWDKKPYRLKFDSKFDLFGNGEAKSWTLIANYADRSLIRNYLAYTVGALFDGIKDTTTTVQFVDLYLNGEYLGVYLVCEQMEVGENRVNIEDNFFKAMSPENMGFLLELDALDRLDGIEGRDYFIGADGKYYAIISPDYEDANETVNFADYAQYIMDYMLETWEALYSNDWALVCQFIDVNSFADSYIVHELFNMFDVGYSSFYVYKKQNDKIYSGPIWDFDLSVGNCYSVHDAKNPDFLWAASKNPWYETLLKYEEFRQLVASKLSSYNEQIRDKIDSEIQNIYQYQDAFVRNFERWNILGMSIYPWASDLKVIETWEGQVEYVRNWLLESLDFLLSYYCS